MKQPFVSVILPVLNVSSTITEVLESLLHQSYKQEQFEVLIVDNGSTDNTRSIVRKYPFMLLLEDEIRGPYAARNKGLEHASGEIIALTDGNKIPARSWIEEGIRCLEQNGYDLMGGKVEFMFSKQITLGEVFDSITFLDNEKYLREEKGSLGGNLFFKREVLNQIGNFPQNYRSGMDIYWSRKAFDNGFKIGYCPKVLVFSIARKLRSVLEKSYRIGIGHPLTMYNAGEQVSSVLYHTIGSFSLPSRTGLRERIKRRGKPEYNKHFFRLWCIDYARRLAMGTGRIVGIIKLLQRLYSKEGI